MAIEKRKHRVSIVVEGVEITGWIDYEIQSSMVEPADSFTMSRPWHADAWSALSLDARVRVLIDGVPILDGFIDRRKKHSKESTIEIGGRDRSGRLVQESAPATNYQGLELSEAVRRLASPWFSRVSLSDARNRSARLGRGRKVPKGAEPIIVRQTTAGGGKVHPGQNRWSVIEEIVSQAGLICWSSADGSEIVVGRPNHEQAPQFKFRLARVGDPVPSNVKSLDYEEDIGDGYSMIVAVGTGGGNAQDYGAGLARRSVALDNPDNKTDGTGRDFKYPKRLLLPEKDLDANRDAGNVAERDRDRRNFRRRVVTVEVPNHGQWVTPSSPTIFAPNTMAWVQDLEMEPPLDGDYLIFACTYRGNRGSESDGGESTLLELVPAGTEIVI